MINTDKNRRSPYGSSGYKTRHEMTLDEHTVDVLREFGNGNLSAGVRMAAAFISDWKKVNDMDNDE